jgi:enamine deaminase RidA (YjgF/YER057c/UK114 family)
MLTLAGSTAGSDSAHQGKGDAIMSVEHLNPEGMHQSPVFSQGIIVPAGARILLIGGQNGVDAHGQVVSRGDVVKQTEQALANLQNVLEAAGAGLEDLVKITVIMQQDIDLNAAFGAWMAVWGQRPNPPTVTGFRVAGLANPDFLIEIEAQAVLP